MQFGKWITVEYICLGAHSIKHYNYLSEKKSHFQPWGPKVAIFGRDDIESLYFDVSNFSVPPHHALDTGQFRFWSKFKVPSSVQKWPHYIIWGFLCNIWWIKWWFFYSKCEKSGSQKQEKWENGQKQPILGIFWCFWVTKYVLPQLRPGWKVVFFTIFGDYDGWEAQKSRNSVP